MHAFVRALWRGCLIGCAMAVVFVGSAMPPAHEPGSSGSVAYAGLITQSGPRLTVSDESWQLGPGNYQASIHTLELWYPRESGPAAYAYHKRLPSGYTRKIPLGIVGGCPPYHVTINSGYTGMTVENDWDSSERWVLTVASPIVESKTIDLTIQDQCGGSINPTWTGEVIDKDNTTYFVHLSAIAGGSETGTSSNPKHDIGQIVGPNSGDTTWSGRQVICLDGTHTLSGLSASYGSNNSRLVINANKPRVWTTDVVGDCTLRGSASNSNGANMNVSAGTDFVAAGFNLTNPFVDEVGGGAGERNAFFTGSAGVYAFGGFFLNTFTCTSSPPDSGSNSAAIYYGTGTEAGYTAIIGNTFDDCDTEMPYVMFWDANHQVVMSNTVRNSSTQEGFYIKGGHNDDEFFFAFNVGVTSNSGSFSTIQAINPSSPWSRTGIEYMHNRWVSSGAAPAGYCLRMIGATTSTFEVQSTRNSWKCNHHRFQASEQAGGSFVYDYDSIEHDGTQSSPSAVDIDSAGVTITVGGNNDSGTSGILDNSTGLQEGGPDCTHGAEICTSALVPANDDIFEMRYAA